MTKNTGVQKDTSNWKKPSDFSG